VLKYALTVVVLVSVFRCVSTSEEARTERASNEVTKTPEQRAAGAAREI
jgi:hypothetical protein